MLFPVAGSVFLSLRSLCSSQQEITRNLFFTISLFDFKLHENLIQSRILEQVQSTPAHLHFRSARLHDLSELGKNSYASSSFDCLGFALDPSQERSGNLRKKSSGRREISQLAPLYFTYVCVHFEGKLLRFSPISSSIVTVHRRQTFVLAYLGGECRGKSQLLSLFFGLRVR